MNFAKAPLEKVNPTSILKQQNNTQRSIEDTNNSIGKAFSTVKYSDTIENNRRSNTARHFTVSHNKKIISSTI